MRWLGLALALVAGQASALSCVRPDVASTFQAAQEDEDSYYVLRGSLSFDPSLMPESYVEAAGFEPSPVAAQFEGKALTLSGFQASFDTALTLGPSCAGPWCGAAGPSDDVIIFAKQTASGLEVDVGACPWFMFYNPDSAMVSQLVDCVNGRGCESQF